MEAGTKVAVKDCEDAHPLLRGATGEVYYTILPDLIVMVKLDNPVFGLPSFYGGYFHTIPISALVVIGMRIVLARPIRSLKRALRYWWPKRLTLKSNPRIHAWLWWNL